MNRDHDYIRELLLEAEESPNITILAVMHKDSTDGDYKRLHHLRILGDAGYITAVGPEAYRLTNDGHDYIDAIRSNGIWEKTKSGAAQVGGITLGMMRDLAVAYLKQEAAEKLGITL